jgi:hypothetical protein
MTNLAPARQALEAEGILSLALLSLLLGLRAILIICPQGGPAI